MCVILSLQVRKIVIEFYNLLNVYVNKKCVASILLTRATWYLEMLHSRFKITVT